MALMQTEFVRLMLVKSILDRAITTQITHADGYSLAMEVLACHDASELVLASIAARCPTAKLDEKQYLLKYCAIVGAEFYKGSGFPGGSHWKQLNEARNSLKHAGQIPSPVQFGNVARDTLALLDQICADCLGERLSGLDMSALIQSDATRAAYREAKQAAETATGPEGYKRCLELLAMELSDVLGNSPALQSIPVGDSSAEHAIRASGYGINGNEFLTLQQYLPRTARSASLYRLVFGGRVQWKQSEYDHPGNWTPIATQFCLRVFTEVVLKVQSAGEIPAPLTREYVYVQRITAIEDTFIWRAPDWFGVVVGVPFGTESAMSAPTVIEQLKEGASRTGIVGHLEPEDLKISFPPGTGELLRFEFEGKPDVWELGFISRSKVKITCIPRPQVERGMPGWSLPEVPWEED